MKQYLNQDDKYLTAQGLITTLVELALSRGIGLHKLLRGTGVFEQDLMSVQHQFSLSQQLRLLMQFKLLMKSADSGFLLGSQLANDTSVVAQGVLQSLSIGQALKQLNALRMQLAPLLFSHSYVHNEQYYIELQNAVGLDDEMSQYVLEIYSAAFYQTLKKVAGERVPCQFDFAYKRARHSQEYEQHLGLNVAFEQPITRWVLSKQALRLTNPTFSSFRFSQVNSQLATLNTANSTFVEAVSRVIYQNPALNLEQVASQFAMSSATFKRKLKAHGVRFSALYEEQSKRKAIYLLAMREQCNEQVAMRLSFYDIANFRRAFKRWTGLTPSQLKV
ncbi:MULTISPECIES: helix-turn-helix transcriptional regulator [Pseudoalteromonas]|uniref:AraC family transcriptional regulator n=1 Tax=Pseudoalteromonas lipolytica TaxID=570156 RepID=A0AAD0WD07_9GAMM|nr:MULTISPECIES: AraC family transcriptional regulator ligand-binding domain-containing protein [Pseudoalteromonas]AXV65845.1 AraC family transcriptional regulator [Pseudoalteromonas donghaensis]QPL42016.1 AraC family transcriptional regulator ligand-binding domain-containing protein [Pseudoalteromonas sp. A41-2]